MSVSVSGLIPQNCHFDLDVSVSCLFGPKDVDHLSDHVRGKFQEQCQCQVLFRATPTLN